LPAYVTAVKLTSVSSYGTVQPMKNKTVRFEMVMTPSEAIALTKLAKKSGVSKANMIAGLIRRSAKRSGCWPK